MKIVFVDVDSVANVVQPMANGELIPGTTYVSLQCLYMLPLSSYSAIGGDSCYQYIIGEDYFATVNRRISVTGTPLVDTDNKEYGNIKIAVPK